MALVPRVVIVSRRSEYDELLARHGTAAAAGFFLRQRGRDLAEVRARAEALGVALTLVSAGIPADWRRGEVERADLPRFLFGPEDVVVVVGPDGLVANTAKYLSGQMVIGIDPEPGHNAGVLVPYTADLAPDLIRGAVAEQLTVEDRTMVAAHLDDGQVLYGLNEVYVGHISHQSARYVIAATGRGPERQSSSGLIVSTGTGATGWCSSIARQRADAPDLPAAVEPALAWFVREAWPSPATQVTLTAGRLDRGDSLDLICEGEGMVAFADGIEPDRLALSWGQRLSVAVADRQLHLVAA
jgi:NAD kinase